MNDIFLKTKVLWSQLDPNMHLRHSAYADFAAQARLEMLYALGFDDHTMASAHMGPILFREETIYHKEVRANENISVSCALKKCRADASRWSFEQHIVKADETIAATVLVDGAWIHLGRRKLMAPPAELAQRFLEKLPRTANCLIESVPEK